MKIKILVAMLCLFCSWGRPAVAQDVQKPMKVAYENFKALQGYLRDAESFNAPQNTDAIQAILESLKQTFHKLNEVDSTYRDEPGFVGTLKLVTEILKDSSNRFREGKKDYASWRLRTLSNHCASCHVNYNAKLAYKDSSDAPKGLTDAQRAQFFLSTRQFDRAKASLLKALPESSSGYQAMTLLRQWLVAEVRTLDNPKKSYATLNNLIPDLKLPRSDLEEVKGWLLALRAWADEPQSPISLAKAERIIRAALSDDLRFGTADPVGLLRGTAMLHSLFARKFPQQSERARALYLLGLGYSELPLFVIDEMPEMYLELCIEEFGGSPEAQDSFKLYEQIVLSRFSGSGGRHVPTEVVVRVIELYKKAHGIPVFDGKV